MNNETHNDFVYTCEKTEMDISVHNFKLFYGNIEKKIVQFSHILKDKQLLNSLNWLALLSNGGTSGIRTKIISL